MLNGSTGGSACPAGNTPRSKSAPNSLSLSFPPWTVFAMRSCSLWHTVSRRYTTVHIKLVCGPCVGLRWATLLYRCSSCLYFCQTVCPAFKTLMYAFKHHMSTWSVPCMLLHTQSVCVIAGISAGWRRWYCQDLDHQPVPVPLQP